MNRPTTIRVLLPVIAVLAFACSTAPPVQERMLIDPHTVVFAVTDSVRTVSITHSCSCPFSWISSVVPASPWLIVPSSMSGDHASVFFQIDRSKLTTDSSMAIVHITSNAYGEDSILIKAYR